MDKVEQADRVISIKTKELVANYVDDILSGKYDFVNGADVMKNKVYFIKYFISWFLLWKHIDPNDIETNKQIHLFNKILEKYNIEFFKEIDYDTLAGMIMEKVIDAHTVFELILTFSP